MRPYDHSVLTEQLATAAKRTMPAQRMARNFHASSLADCLRATGYQLLGIAPVEPFYDADYAMAAECGNAIHTAIQAQMVAAGVVVTLPDGTPAIEVPLAEHASADLPRYLLSGRIDAIIRTRDGGMAVLDIKTVAAKYMQESYRYLPEKLAHYEAQVQAYLHFLRLGSVQITRGLIYMVSRDDTKQRRLLSFSYDTELIGQHLARLVVAADAVRMGELPPAEPHLGPCLFCSYRARCEGERNGHG